MIQVTKTYLPNIDKYKKYVDEIYESGWITNGGAMVKILERRLEKYLGVKNIILVANGTLALKVAYMALDLKGSVITTPFSFVATTSSLVLSGLKPKFADIDKNTWNIDTSEIESKIESDTSAIVPVHIFGNVCNVENIKKIAKKNKLKVIYDSAHCFGVKYKGKSVLNYGDISILSFHATKLFHTIEGGALVVNDDKLVQKIRYLINFGIENEESIPELGINAKMNEFEAAMGLSVLDEIENITCKRKTIYKFYEKELFGYIEFQKKSEQSSLNYGYFPVLFKDESELKKVQKALKKQNIFARRYFYPSLDTLKYIEPKQLCTNAREVASKVLCLPIFPDLKINEQEKIVSIIKENL